MEQIKELISRYNGLEMAKETIVGAAELIIDAYKNGKTVYLCGNGGSASDSDHIVGELMKGFLKKRPVCEEFRKSLKETSPEDADFLANNLQCGLPAVSLHSQSSLLTAFANDVDASMMYAQTLYSLANKGDVLVAISTSGNSANVVNAAKVARAMGVRVISMSGKKECKLDLLADISIHVDATETYKVQELHLPAYHWICARVEKEFFSI